MRFDRLLAALGVRQRRTLNRLSINEIDAEWVLTSTSSLFRFHDGRWECSRHVYYGKDDGWFGWSSEPSGIQGVLVEKLPNDTIDTLGVAVTRAVREYKRNEKTKEKKDMYR